VREIDSAGGVKTLSTSEVLQTMPTRLTGDVISAFVSFLEMAEQQRRRHQYVCKISPHPSAEAKE
jgi:hypothetical protein